MRLEAKSREVSVGAFMRLVLIATASGVLAGLGLARLAPPAELSGPRARPFERVAWCAAEGKGSESRGAMARDLVERLLRPGMPRAEVHALLGEPSRFPIFLGASWFGREDEAWWIGPSGSMLRGACDWLYLDYDASGKLVRAKVVSEHAAEEREP